MFIALLVGAFSLGQAAPSLQDFSVALGAAGFIYDTINRVSGHMLSIMVRTCVRVCLYLCVTYYCLV